MEREGDTPLMCADSVEWSRIKVLTFDCYGTLIDWEAGILASLHEVLGWAAIPGADDDALLEEYGAIESELEGGAWMPYGSVLAEALGAVCRNHGRAPTEDQARRFARSVADWPAFPDSAAALATLAERFELGVVTNCDDDLFAASNERLGRPFSWVVTAEQVRSYKPAPKHFERVLELAGRPVDAVLHVAQSLYHDHVPAQRLGLRTAWIDRRNGRKGSGATPAAQARPTLVTADMATFARIATEAVANFGTR